MNKVTFSIQYAGLNLEIAKNDRGEDVTPLKPISDLFGLRWQRQRQKVLENEFSRSYLGVCIRKKGDADIHMCTDSTPSDGEIFIQLDRVAAFLMSISPDRVRVNGNISGAEYLTQKLNEWADALHDYEQLGVAVNLNHARAHEVLRKQRAAFAQMMGVKARTADAGDRKALTQVLKQMAGELGVTYQSDLIDG